MSTDCIFCQIIAGEIPSHTVYEDDAVIAFLDANPLAEGHTLVIPKEHYKTTDEMPASVGAAIGRALTELTPIVEATVGADASTIGINNGPAAGQEIPHVHAHIIPRDRGDTAGPIHGLFAGQQDISDEALADLAEQMRAAGQP